MKITAIVQAVGLASIFSSQGMASPAVTDGKALSLTERTASHNAANAAVEKRSFIPIWQGIDGVHRYSSEVLAAQFEGAATSLRQLKEYCAHAPALMKRLANQDLNTTLITEAICAASKQPILATDHDIVNKTAEARTLLWIVEAIPACGYQFNKLCNLIDIDGANSIGLNGNRVKDQICGIGG